MKICCIFDKKLWDYISTLERKRVFFLRKIIIQYINNPFKLENEVQKRKRQDVYSRWFDIDDFVGKRYFEKISYCKYKTLVVEELAVRYLKDNNLYKEYLEFKKKQPKTEPNKIIKYMKKHRNNFLNEAKNDLEGIIDWLNVLKMVEEGKIKDKEELKLYGFDFDVVI